MALFILTPSTTIKTRLASNPLKTGLPPPPWDFWILMLGLISKRSAPVATPPISMSFCEIIPTCSAILSLVTWDRATESTTSSKTSSSEINGTTFFPCKISRIEMVKGWYPIRLNLILPLRGKLLSIAFPRALVTRLWFPSSEKTTTFSKGSPVIPSSTQMSWPQRLCKPKKGRISRKKLFLAKDFMEYIDWFYFSKTL